MTEKKLKTIRRTVIVIADEDIPVDTRAMQWEAAGKSNNRQVYRIERAAPGPWTTDEQAYIIDMELTCKGANRNDFSKFVERYLPEVEYHFITD